MMVLAELLIETENLRQKIVQLENYLHRTAKLDAEAANIATTKLLDLLDKHRSHLILVNRVNNDVQMNIGGSTVSLANAILITKTMRLKIKLLDSLIEDDDVSLDVFDLIDQRDKLLEEYTTISNGIKSVEWRTNIDQESVG
jgi:hypothetical protein